MMKILLVDDEAYSLRSMFEHLRETGVSVTSVESLPIAEKALRAEAFGVICIDCLFASGQDHMEPNEAGLELIRKIRIGDPDVGQLNRKSELIVLTGVSERHTLDRLSKSGVTRILQKPVSTRELIRQLKPGRRQIAKRSSRRGRAPAD